MLGNPINSEQVKLYMNERKEGKSQETAAAKAGMSERSGRRIEKGEHRSGTGQIRIGGPERIPLVVFGKRKLNRCS